MTQATEAIDVTARIDQRGMTRFLGLLIACAAGVMMLDGFDAIAISVSAPAIMHERHIDPARFGAVLGLGQAGAVLGTFVFGLLADRIGRRPTILIAVGILAAFSLGTAFAETLTAFLMVRFAVGIGIGGVKPPLIALISDYSPRRLRVSAVTTMYLGYGVGTLIVSLSSIVLLRHFSWQMLFLIGGVVPMILWLVLFFVLPESVHYLINRGRPANQIADALRRADRSFLASEGMSFLREDLIDGKRPRFALAALFAGSLRTATPLLWLSVVANGLTFYFVGFWIPTLVRTALGSSAQAGFALACFSFGGIFGGFVLMRLIDRLGLIVLSVTPVLAFALILVMGSVSPASGIFYVIALLAGICLIGSNYSMIGVSARFYPSHIRATGAGAVTMMGALASIAGPWLGGVVIGMKLPLTTVFGIAAAPLPIFAVCILALNGLQRASARRGEQVIA